MQLEDISLSIEKSAAIDAFYNVNKKRHNTANHIPI